MIKDLFARAYEKVVLNKICPKDRKKKRGNKQLKSIKIEARRPRVMDRPPLLVPFKDFLKYAVVVDKKIKRYTHLPVIFYVDRGGARLGNFLASRRNILPRKIVVREENDCIFFEPIHLPKDMVDYVVIAEDLYDSGITANLVVREMRAYLDRSGYENTKIIFAPLLKRRYTTEGHQIKISTPCKLLYGHRIKTNRYIKFFWER